MASFPTAQSVDPRALAGLGAAGAGAALLIACAYLGGGLARGAVDRADAEGLHRHELALLAARAEGRATLLAEAEAQAARAIHLLTAPFAAPLQSRSTRDLQCLAQAVYYESRGESLAGQEAVAQVVLNRVRHPAFPKSVCGVVFQRHARVCQFSFACDGSMSKRMEPAAWAHARKVAAAAIAGEAPSPVGDAVAFHVASLGRLWESTLLRVTQIGSHAFYRFGSGAAAPRLYRVGAPRSPDPPSLARMVAGTEAAPQSEAQAERVVLASTAAPARPLPPSDAVARLPGSDAAPAITVTRAAETSPLP